MTKQATIDGVCTLILNFQIHDIEKRPI